MVKSREITIQSDGADMHSIFDEAEKFADEMNLTGKDKIHFRLLTEETMGMLKTITGEISVGVAFLGKNNEITIHLETYTNMNMQKREDLLSVSTSGKNESAKGVMGKIREAFEFAFNSPYADSTDAWMAYGTPALTKGVPVSPTAMNMMDSTYWSLAQYSENIEYKENSGEEREEWDELEKSIVFNLAKDVRIGIKGKKVFMDVVMK